MNKNTVMRIIFGALSIFCMVAIFMFSAQNAGKSEKTSGFVTKTIAKAVIKDYEKLPKQQQKSKIDELQPYIRKTAHFSIYAFLGFSFFLFLSTFNLTKKKILIFTLLATLVYAASDEIHQLFSDGRAFMVTDICLDEAGSFCGVLVAMLAQLLIFRNKASLSEENKQKKLKIKNFEKTIDKSV